MILTMITLLLVEDDQDLGKILKQYLEMQGFRVLLAGTGEKGWTLFLEEHPALCILDIMLPGMDGLSLGKKIKQKNADQPLLFLTARTSKEDILKGLKTGADDYICKPFEPEELVLRIRNILRRTGRLEPEALHIGKFLFIPDRLELSGYGNTYRLTLKESQLLKYLLAHRDQLLRREDILVELWGENDYFLGRSLDVFISRIRKYLKPGKDIQLETIRGVGYVLRTTIDDPRPNGRSSGRG